MRNGPVRVGVFVAFLLAVFAGSAMASSTKVILGDLELVFGGDISPKALPKNKLTPITLGVSGSIRTLDGKHIPALKEAIVDTDKNGTIDPEGVPICKQGKLEATTTPGALKACK